MSGCFNNQPGTVLSNSSSCPLGFYCPNILERNSSTLPTQCTPSQICSEYRLLGLNCNDGPAGAYGAQGLYEPVICPPGYYCPTTAEIFPCPQGYFCLTGTYAPVKCDYISSCPQGTTTQTSFVGIVSFAVIDFFLLVVYFLLQREHFQKIKATESTFTYAKQPSTPPKILFMNSVNASDSSRGSSIEIDTDTIQTEYAANEKHQEAAVLIDVKSTLASNFKSAMNGKKLRMHFEMDHLGLKLPTGKEILRGVTGRIHAGKMTAIMGPSGAGKTTFLNVLCGKIRRTSGTMKISGKEGELQTFKKICGFVPQEDLMLRELTVRENILHSARIRAPKSWNPKQIEDHVDSIIEALNLSDVKHALIGDGIVGGISGGQRKRVNIGIEVAATPLCLFLDEPTSGLDSTSSLEVMDMLDQISKIGMTVVAIIHQPRMEIFTKFDDVLMIAPGGKTAYLGPSSEARPYFENLGFEFTKGSNDADILMDILSGQGVNRKQALSIEDLVDRWSDYYSSEHGALAKDIVDVQREKEDQEFHSQASILSKERGASFLRQVWFAHNLSIIQQFRLFSGLIAEIVVAALAGLVIGAALSGHDEVYIGIYRPPFTLLSPSPKLMIFTQLCMLTGTAVALIGAPAGVKTFSEELPVYWRNAASGHSPLAYYVAKTICSTYRLAIGGLHFAAMIFTLARPATAYWYWLVYIILMFYGVYGLSSIVSMITKRENAALIAVVVCLFSCAFCGYGISINKVTSWGLLWFWNLQFSLFGTEALFSQTLNVYDHVFNSYLSNVEYGYTLNRIPFDFGMMVLIGTLWRVVAYLCMIGFNRDRQK